MNAIMISPGGSLRVIREDTDDLLGFCYRNISCDCIEIVRPTELPDPYVMIVDENGRLRDLPVNPVASILYGVVRHGETIVGTALIMKEAMTDDGPDIVSLDDADLRNLTGGDLR